MPVLALVAEQLEIFVDESGDDRVYLAAGLLAPAGKWEAFDPEWNRVLAIKPAMPYWHQSDVWANKPPFNQLSRGQQCERERLLAQVITDVAPACAITVMTDREYKQSLNPKLDIPKSDNPDAERVRRGLRLGQTSPYHMLNMLWCQQVYLHLKDSSSRDGVRLVIESAKKNEDDLVRDALQRGSVAYQVDGFENMFTSITHAKGKTPDFRPLEAVDMYAWALRRYLSKRPHHLLDCFTGLPAEALILTAEQMRSFTLTNLKGPPPGWTKPSDPIPEGY